jgi:serine/threonine-protein kinase
MKRVEGVNWGDLLDDPAHPAWQTHCGESDRLDANIDILIAICRVLELAHFRGFIHRDIKPANVMLGRFGEVYLVDWGLATVIGTAGPADFGTPAYMAPEMATGDAVDQTTDVYLLGATLHRVLTGKPRHGKGNRSDKVLAAALSLPAHFPASVPAALGDLCNRACSASKTERPSSVQALREELAQFKQRRGAMIICDAAQARLAQLERLLQAPGVPSDLALAYRLGAEAALMEEIPGARGSCAASVEKLRQSARERVEEDARLKALERDLDPRIGWQWQVAPTLLYLLLHVAGLLALQLGPATRSVPSAMALLVGWGGAVCLAVATLAVWAHVRAHR